MATIPPPVAPTGGMEDISRRHDMKEKALAAFRATPDSHGE